MSRIGNTERMIKRETPAADPLDGIRRRLAAALFRPWSSGKWSNDEPPYEVHAINMTDDGGSLFRAFDTAAWGAAEYRGAIAGIVEFIINAPRDLQTLIEDRDALVSRVQVEQAARGVLVRLIEGQQAEIAALRTQLDLMRNVMKEGAAG